MALVVSAARGCGGGEDVSFRVLLLSFSCW